VPSNSVTLFILPGVTNPVVRTAVMGPGHTFGFWMDGTAGQRYIILASSNLVNWVPVSTNAPDRHGYESYVFRAGHAAVLSGGVDAVGGC